MSVNRKTSLSIPHTGIPQLHPQEPETHRAACELIVRSQERQPTGREDTGAKSGQMRSIPAHESGRQGL